MFSILYALLLLKHVQSHIPNNYKVINKKSCNTLSPSILTMQSDTTMHVVSFLYEKCHSVSVVTLLGYFEHYSNTHYI